MQVIVSKSLILIGMHSYRKASDVVDRIRQYFHVRLPMELSVPSHWTSRSRDFVDKRNIPAQFFFHFIPKPRKIKGELN